MPPPESHLTLSAAEKALLKRWVVEGADYRPHWSLVPVHAVGVPRLRDGTAPANPIDAFVRTRLEAEGLTPAPQASPEIAIRRLALNLTGLPPAPADLDAFLADRSPDAYARVVEQLPGVSGLRRADGDGLARPRALRRHVWLSGRRRPRHVGLSRLGHRRVQRNLPYDQFLTWQLAGDLLPNPTREQRIATAFNRLHRQTNEGGSIEEEFRTEYVVDRVNTFSTAMLGLTMECARCHDHKFDADHAARLLFDVRLLQQHRRVGPVLAFHQRHAVPFPAALDAREGDAARSADGAHRRGRSQARGRLPIRATGVQRPGWRRRSCSPAVRTREPGSAGRRVAGRDISRPCRSPISSSTPSTARRRRTASRPCQRSCRTGRCWCTRDRPPRSGSAATIRSSIPACASSPGPTRSR